MPWQVEVLNQRVFEELDALPADLRAKFDHVVRLVEDLGLHQVREPYIKALRDKLWEIRVRGRSGIARAIYVTASEQRIIILHAFIKKAQKTPKSAIDTAVDRMKELNRRTA